MITISRQAKLIAPILILIVMNACSSAPTTAVGTGPTAAQSPSVPPTATSSPVPPTATAVPTATSQTVLVSQTPFPLKTITVESASQLALLTKLDARDISDALAFSADGNTLAAGLAKESFYRDIVGDNKIWIWNLPDASMIKEIIIPGKLSSFAFQGDQLTIATCTAGVWYGCAKSEILGWRAPDAEPVHAKDVKGLIYTIPPEGMPAVLHLSTTSFDNYELWDLKGDAPQKLYDIVQTTEWDAAMAYAPDGGHYAIGIGTSIRLFQPESDEPVLLEDPENLNKNRFKSFVFSPDSSILASADGVGHIKFWQVSDGRFLRELQGHTGAVETMAFSSDGKLLVSISSDHTLRVWNAEDATLLATLSGACSGSGYKSARCFVAISPTGNLIASVGWPDKHILLWGIP